MGFAVTSYNGAVGILSAQIVSLDQTLNLPSSDTELDTDENRYELFRTPAAAIDNNILVKYVNPINAQKDTIVTNGQISVFESNPIFYASESAALTALEALYGAHTSDTGVYSSRQVLASLRFPGSVLINAPIGATVTQAGNPDVINGQNAVNGKVFGSGETIAGSPYLLVSNVDNGNFTTHQSSIFPNAGVGQTVFINGVPIAVGVSPVNSDFIAVADIHDDIDVMHVYPNLEPTVNSNDDDIFGGAKNVILSQSNKGLGIANTFFANGLSTSTSSPVPSLGIFVEIEGSSSAVPKRGEVFTFNTASGSSQASAISASRTAIGELRVGTSDPTNVGVTTFNNASRIVKDNKQSFAIHVWSGRRMRQVATNDKASFLTAINILEDSSYQS
tara:strand:+ start:1493 stop:2662 length:1170 start_codon:yes stop_codon:yes gene_type:complete